MKTVHRQHYGTGWSRRVARYLVNVTTDGRTAFGGVDSAAQWPKWGRLQVSGFGVECGQAALAFSKDDVSRAAVLPPDEPLTDQSQACVFESVAFIIKATARQLLKAKPRVESHGLPIVSVNLKLEFTLKVQGM